MSLQRVKHPQKLGDKLGEPDSRDISFVALFEGWVEDLLRLHACLTNHLVGHDWELVVVDNPVDDEASERMAALARTVHIPLAQAVGYGAGRNLGIRQAGGRIVVVVDTSVEATGDIAAPLIDQLDGGERIGLIGRWGVTSPNGFDFEETDGAGEERRADGVEAYLMAARRATLAQAGLFDPKFKWYRNADIDLSFRVRDAGFDTVLDPTLPVVRHEHRLWESTPEAEREQLSRKNFWRFRDHWGERADLFVAREE